MREQFFLNMVVIFLVVGVFYIVIPGLGAFHVRKRWRQFRKMITEYSLYPIIDYRNFQRLTELRGFRFFGVLEAVQDNKIWIRNNRFSVQVEVGEGEIFFLPSESHTLKRINESETALGIPDEMPRRLNWKRLFARPLGTRVFVGGMADAENDIPVFRDTADNPLLLVFYDGSEKTVLKRAIWEGRQKNEFWNPYTPISMLIGAFSLIFTAYVLFRQPSNQFSAILSLCFGFLPVLPFLPPGILLLSLYRFFWNYGRALRAERDLLRLPLRFFSEHHPGKQSLSLTGGKFYKADSHDTIEQAMSGVFDVELRSPRFLTGKKADIEKFYSFSTRDGQDNPVDPEDPMLEQLVIPGNPALISLACDHRAKLYEVLGVVLVSFGIIMNFFLLYLIIVRAIH